MSHMLSLNDYKELMEKCTYCQQCQNSCPVYMSEMIETDVSRARVALIKAAFIDNELPVNKRLKEIINRCMMCTTCSRDCPAGVSVDEIVAAARQLLYKGKRRNIIERKMMQQAMNQRGPKGLMDKAVSMGKKLGMNLADLPKAAPRAFEDMYSGIVSPQGKKRARVAYFVGCATNTFYPDTGEAVVKVLSLNGIEIVLPEGLVCCGLPALVDGDMETAQEMLRADISILGDMDVDAVVTDCTSCGLMLKEKAVKIFPAGDPVLEKARAIAAKIWEATDYLHHMGLVSEPDALSEDYTYHMPCHRGWSQNLDDAPRHLLAAIPESRLVEMEHPGKCCGAGGAFFVEHKELAEDIRSVKTGDIEKTGAKTIVVQCPSCRTYLGAALGDDRVMHPVYFLARAYGIF